MYIYACMHVSMRASLCTMYYIIGDYVYSLVAFGLVLYLRHVATSIIATTEFQLQMAKLHTCTLSTSPFNAFLLWYITISFGILNEYTMMSEWLDLHVYEVQHCTCTCVCICISWCWSTCININDLQILKYYEVYISLIFVSLQVIGWRFGILSLLVMHYI